MEPELQNTQKSQKAEYFQLWRPFSQNACVGKRFWKLRMKIHEIKLEIVVTI